MSQNKGILSLLDDDDDEDDNEEHGAGTNQPAASTSAKAQWPGTTSFPKGTLPRLPPLQVATPSQPAAASSQRSQGPQINMRHLLEFCKLKFPADEYKSIVTEFAGLKASNPDSREMLAKIRSRIGPEVIQQFTSQIKLAAAANGQNNPLTQSPHTQQQQPRQAMQPQQTASQPGGSIMQSLKYNAEQSRQQKPGGLVPEQPAFSHQGPSGDPLRAFQQQQGSQAQPKVPLPSFSNSQHRPQFPGVAASVSHERPGEHSQQARAPLPSVLGKQPDAPAQTQPTAKRAKKDKDDVVDENDIFKDSGINLEDEQNALLGQKGATEAPVLPRPQSTVAEQTFLNQSPLQIKVVDIAKRHGLESVDQQVGQLLSRALETHLGGLIRQVFAMARQRTDTDRMRPGMVLTGNLRKRLHEINARERDRQKAQEAEAADQQQAVTSKRKQAAEDAKRADKASMRDSDKQQASAANAAAAAAFGSKAQKWGAWSTGAAKNPGSASQKAEAPDVAMSGADKAAEGKKEASNASNAKSAGEGGQKGSFLPPSKVKAEMLSAKLPDLIAVMEGHHMYQKSVLLYKLYEQLTD